MLTTWKRDTLPLYLSEWNTLGGITQQHQNGQNCTKTDKCVSA